MRDAGILFFLLWYFSKCKKYYSCLLHWRWKIIWYVFVSVFYTACMVLVTFKPSYGANWTYFSTSKCLILLGLGWSKWAQVLHIWMHICISSNFPKYQIVFQKKLYFKFGWTATPTRTSSFLKAWSVSYEINQIWNCINEWW